MTARVARGRGIARPVKPPAQSARTRPVARAATRAVRPRDPESELWSAFGYETICLFWGLPNKAFRALSEPERHRLARVSNRIDDMSAADKEPLLREIVRNTPTKRLALFRRLARRLAAGRPIVAKPRPVVGRR